jgi:hypothetical protein
VRQTTHKLVAARHVLAEDVDAIVERAGQLWDYLHGDAAASHRPQAASGL